jgi:hypothetical protein
LRSFLLASLRYHPQHPVILGGKDKGKDCTCGNQCHPTDTNKISIEKIGVLFCKFETVALKLIDQLKFIANLFNGLLNIVLKTSACISEAVLSRVSNANDLSVSPQASFI